MFNVSKFIDSAAWYAEATVLRHVTHGEQVFANDFSRSYFKLFSKPVTQHSRSVRRTENFRWIRESRSYFDFLMGAETCFASQYCGNASQIMRKCIILCFIACVHERQIVCEWLNIFSNLWIERHWCIITAYLVFNIHVALEILIHKIYKNSLVISCDDNNRMPARNCCQPMSSCNFLYFILYFRNFSINSSIIGRLSVYYLLIPLFTWFEIDNTIYK